MADFTFLPDSVLEETPEFSTIISRFENGCEQRRPRRTNPIRRWRLTFTNNTADEMKNVYDFFKEKLGAYQSFTWVNPNDNTEYTVRFAEDSFTITRHAYNAYDFEVSLIEVL